MDSLDSSDAYDLNCISVVVLNNCDPELTEFFNMCLDDSCFPDYWQVLSAIPVFTNLGEISAKKYHFTSFLFVFSKISKTLKDF